MLKIDEKDLREAIGGVPAHIEAIGFALRYDIMQGPSWIIVPQGDVTKIDDDCVYFLYEDADDDAEEGDIIEETYTCLAAEAFAQWVDNLPTLYYEDWSGFLSEYEPEGYEDEETGEWFEPEPYYTLDRKDILAVLFGETFAREYN